MSDAPAASGLTGISSKATRKLLAELTSSLPAGLPAVTVESVGGVDAEKRVAAGEAFDLVFLASGALKRLADACHVDAASVTPLVVSQVAVAVPASEGDPEVAARPDGTAYPDAAGLREALLGAERIGYSTGPSGNALVAMIDEWGLTDELSGRLIQARPGVPVASLVASGEADLGLQQLSELVGEKGIRVLGVLPEDCAIDTIFSGAVATASSHPAEAAGVLEYLASDATTPTRTELCFGTPS